MANYWTRRNDHTDETTTVNPWEEVIGHGEVRYPDPDSDYVLMRRECPYCGSTNTATMCDGNLICHDCGMMHK